jgi:nucleotide-binding universal stress UspA family protein
MYKRILIPLDGSRLAESALQPAALLSTKLGASITLVHVIEENAPALVHGDRHLTTEDEACSYLDEIAQRSFSKATEVDCHVHSEEVRNVGRSITHHVFEFEPDLIVMCAHGQSGFRDMLLGNIAQQVIGAAKTPVLLIQPGDPSQPQEVKFKRLLVGLDGEPEHECSLTTAGELALKLTAELHLVHVVHTTGTLQGGRAAAASMLPGTAKAMLDMMTSSAQEYLKEKASLWQSRGLVTKTHVCRGDIPRELARVATDMECDLIVLGTHGRSGAGAFWSASVAPKVISHTQVPILFVPADCK